TAMSTALNIPLSDDRACVSGSSKPAHEDTDQMTRTYANTTRVSKRLVTTTSRIGSTKFVTKRTIITTVRTTTARVVIAPGNVQDLILTTRAPIEEKLHG
ncbi:hypothetical protein BaRGS_00017008, partial [Batillaria attramentaria]